MNIKLATTAASLPHVPDVDFILSTKEVCKIVGMSRYTIYRLIGEEQFPRPARLGLRRVGWRTSHINAWLDSKFSG